MPPSETGSAGSTANFDEAGLESEDEAEDLVGDWTLELRFPDDAHDPLILRCHVETEDSVVLYLDDGTELTLSYGAETTSPLAGEGECLWIANEDGSLYCTIQAHTPMIAPAGILDSLRRNIRTMAISSCRIPQYWTLNTLWLAIPSTKPLETAMY